MEQKKIETRLPSWANRKQYDAWHTMKNHGLEKITLMADNIVKVLDEDIVYMEHYLAKLHNNNVLVICSYHKNERTGISITLKSIIDHEQTEFEKSIESDASRNMEAEPRS